MNKKKHTLGRTAYIAIKSDDPDYLKTIREAEFHGNAPRNNIRTVKRDK